MTVRITFRPTTTRTRTLPAQAREPTGGRTRPAATSRVNAPRARSVATVRLTARGRYRVPPPSSADGVTSTVTRAGALVSPRESVAV